MRGARQPIDLPEAFFKVRKGNLFHHGRIPDECNGSQHALQVLHGLGLLLQTLPNGCQSVLDFLQSTRRAAEHVVLHSHCMQTNLRALMQQQCKLEGMAFGIAGQVVAGLLCPSTVQAVCNS